MLASSNGLSGSTFRNMASVHASSSAEMAECQRLCQFGNISVQEVRL